MNPILAWGDHDYIRIVTFIEQGDLFPGEKSRHTVYWLKGKQEYHTGTTNIYIPDYLPFGGKVHRVKSRGDDFKYTRGRSGVTISGATASGLTLGVGPFINYQFNFDGNSENASISGCHDGFPSYKVYENGKLIYYYKHQKTRVYKLIGKCDVKINFRYKYPSLDH